jgi:hypothetical protein
VNLVKQQDRLPNLVLIVTIAIAVLLFFINPFLAAVVLIIFLILFMSYRIMEETTHLPDVIAKLPENAKGIILLNRGNDRAVDIHVTVVPLNMEFDIPALEADEEHIIAFPQMIEEVKVVLSFKNTEGRAFSRSRRLSPLIEDEEDMLKPAFPLFGWK